MKSTSKIEYIEALSNYFYKTKGYIYPAIRDKVQDEFNIIQNYESKNIPESKDFIIAKAFTKILGRLIATIIFCTLAVYVINEVFGTTIMFSIKNILLLTILFYAYKSKFRIGREDEKIGIRKESE